MPTALAENIMQSITKLRLHTHRQVPINKSVKSCALYAAGVQLRDECIHGVFKLFVICAIGADVEFAEAEVL